MLPVELIKAIIPTNIKNKIYFIDSLKNLLLLDQ